MLYDAEDKAFDPFEQGFGFAVGFMTKYNVSQKVPRPGSETLYADPRKVKITIEQINTDSAGNKVAEESYTL